MRRVIAGILVCGSTVACSGKKHVADELAALAASDTTCRMISANRPYSRIGVARTFALQTHDRSLTIALGVDSANRPRMFSAMVTSNTGHTTHVKMDGAYYATDGAMFQASRIFLNHNSDGTGDQKSVKLSEADTAKVRKLTAELVRRCVR